MKKSNYRYLRDKFRKECIRKTCLFELYFEFRIVKKNTTLEKNTKIDFKLRSHLFYHSYIFLCDIDKISDKNEYFRWPLIKNRYNLYNLYDRTLI